MASLRPHAKTHKSPHIARMQLAAGAVGLTCAKLGEAEVLVEQGGVTDILIAYPIVGDIKIRRLLHLLDRARVIVAVDTHQAAALSQAMSASDRTLDIYLEVNTGQDRRARAGQEAADLAVAISLLPGLRLAGVMTHEGHAGFSSPDEIAIVAQNAGRALVDTAEHQDPGHRGRLPRSASDRLPPRGSRRESRGSPRCDRAPTSSTTITRSGTAASVPIAARPGSSPPSSAARLRIGPSSMPAPKR